jgi:hypothetical protein
MTPYIYLFIREDLGPAQQIIQTAHAVDDLYRTIKPGDRTNHMVLFSIRSEQDLEETSMYLKDNDIHHEMFYEPDVLAHTAIATEPIRGEKRNLFRKFKMKKN